MSQVCVRVVCAWASMSRYMKVHTYVQGAYLDSSCDSRTALYVMYVRILARREVRTYVRTCIECIL